MSLFVFTGNGKQTLDTEESKKKKKKNKFLTISKSLLPLQSQQTGSRLTDVKKGKTNKIETASLAKQTRRKRLGNTR
jgi:hypothetical protein